MRINVDPKWVVKQLLFLVVSVTLLTFDYVLPGLAIFALFFQGTFHEFSHAFVIWITKGTITTITLSKISYIDFDNVSIPGVYLAGFLWDFVFTSIAAFCLFKTGNPLFIAIAIVLLSLASLYHIYPVESDFNQWLASKDKVYHM